MSRHRLDGHYHDYYGFITATTIITIIIISISIVSTMITAIITITISITAAARRVLSRKIQST